MTKKERDKETLDILKQDFREAFKQWIESRGLGDE